MTLTVQEVEEIVTILKGLTDDQQRWIQKSIKAFKVPQKFQRLDSSDLITEAALKSLGDRLITHHAGSKAALSKDRFEYALEEAMSLAGFRAELAKSRTNRGHDITINGTPIALKTQADKGIKENLIHVSKWMELGKGPWELERLRDLFLEHMQNYDRIFTLRFLTKTPELIRYELVEIPKKLLLESTHCTFETMEDSRQDPKPGYGYVKDSSGALKYALYFDGGGERKLQIKHLDKSKCIVHATWEFGSGLTD